MPTSRYKHLPAILDIVLSQEPLSILDVGAGFGKWGLLFREYTDIAAVDAEPARYGKDGWKVRIDGVEGFPDYLTPAHDYVYNNVYVGDMCALIPEMDRYDVIFLGDVIEHVELEQGKALLRACAERANRLVLVTTPARTGPQEAVCGNTLEEHRSAWTYRDFEALAPSVTAIIHGKLMALLFPSDEARTQATGALPRRVRPGLRQAVKKRIVTDLLPSKS